MIIAIDGPAGSGKSTIAREVAKRLGIRYLDTGAMYRTVTLLALEAGLVPDRISESGKLAVDADMRFVARPNDLTRVFVGEREVTDEIRGRLVSQNVSAVSADAQVRAVLTERQRLEVARGDVVLEGRDMGTVVAPAADVKVFLTASVEERALRRQLQLQAQGLTQPLEELEADITARDAYDSGRALAPLRKADDAVEIDTTGMTIEEVIDAVCGLAAQAASQTNSAPTAVAAAGPASAPSSTSVPCPSRWPLSRLIRSPLDNWLYRTLYSMLRPVLQLLFRVQVIGVENVPRNGGVVVACNHRSNLDPFFLGCACSREIHFMAKAEVWRCKPLGWLVEKLGTFPVRRGEVDRQAVRQAFDILDQGAVLGLFPEGRRQRETDLGEIRPGAGLFSLREGVVTIPVVIRGSDRVIRHHMMFFPKITVTYGAPLELPEGPLSRADRTEEAIRRLVHSFQALLSLSEVNS